MKSLKNFFFLVQPSLYLFIASFIFVLLPNNLLHMSPDCSFPFIYFWTIFKPEVLPLFVLLSIGIMIDSVQGLPLGFHSVLFLFSSMIILYQRNFLYHQSFSLVWLFFSLFLIIYKALEQLIFKSIMDFPFSFFDLVMSVLFTIFLYPLCSRISYSNLKRVINLS
ncbi:MAG: hypothetical protein BGO77_01250 [Caedibacter sp. 37-49]|nr:MAG: hypothetical protein BGO77_01250 [Caedibacter sp. 37-49]